MDLHDHPDILALHDTYFAALSAYQDRRVVDPVKSVAVDRLGDAYRRAARTAMVKQWVHVFDLTYSRVRRAQIARIMKTGQGEIVLDGLSEWLDETCGSGGYGRFTCDIWGWPVYVGIVDRDRAREFVRRWMFGPRPSSGTPRIRGLAT